MEAHKQAFFTNPCINPETNKRITLGGHTYYRLVAKYGKPWKAYEPFTRWTVFVERNVYGVKDENGQIIASKRANTRPLKATFSYTIYCNKGSICIWVEPHYNPPFFIGVDVIAPIPPQLYETHQPNKLVGNWRMFNHQCVFEEPI
jgi:hypothetical protein